MKNFWPDLKQYTINQLSTLCQMNLNSSNCAMYLYVPKENELDIVEDKLSSTKMLLYLLIVIIW